MVTAFGREKIKARIYIEEITGVARFLITSKYSITTWNCSHSYNTIPSQHFHIVSTVRINIVENETKRVVRFSTLHNVDLKSVSNIETTLQNVFSTLLQR